MSTKVKIKLVDHEGNVTDKGRLFITDRPALFRWLIKDGKKEHATYFKRTGVDDYTELTPKEVVQMLDWLRHSETDPNELTIDKVAEILSKPHIESPQMVTPATREELDALLDAEGGS